MTTTRMVALALVATTLALRPWGGIAANEAAPARLIEVSSRAAGTSFEVLIEASAPAAYTTHQPDDRTVVVELRNVTADGARLRLARGGPIDDVEIEGAETEDRAGGLTTRVRLQLSRPLPYSVSSSRSTIRVGFDQDAVDPVAAVVAATPNRAAPAPAEAPRPTGGAPATRLQAIETLFDPSAVVVRLGANGILTPSRIHEAEDAPPRLVIDLPGVESAVPGATRVDVGPVRQIRVAPHSHAPLVTRVVFDLESPAPYRVEGLERPSDELRVIFPLDAPIAAVAPPAVGDEPAGAPRSLAALAASSPTGTRDSVPEGPAGQAEAAPPVAANTILLDPLAALRAPSPVSAAQDAAVTGLLAELASPTAPEPDSAPATPIELQSASPTQAESEPASPTPTEAVESAERQPEPAAAAVVAVAAPPETVILAPPVDPLAALTTTTPESVVAELPAATPSLESPPAVVGGTPESVAPGIAERTRPTAGRTQLTIPATLPAASVSGVPTAAPPPAAILRAGLTATRRFSSELPRTRYIHLGGVTNQPRAQVTQQTLGVGRQYTGSPVSMDFQNADLRSVLRTFAEISGLNIVIDPQVQGSVDVALVDVPWDQAFDIILRANQLGYDVDGTVVRIAPLSALADEEQQRRELAEQQALAGALVVLAKPLSYARAADLADLITQAVLSERGQVQIDVRTNTLIITDLQNSLNAAEELIDTLDRPEPQVEIEARIVQARQSYARELGVQWGISGRVAPDIGNTTPLSFPNRGNVTGRVGGSQGPFPVDGRALESETTGTAVDLGAPSRTSALGLTLGAVDGSLNLDVVLSAAEGDGDVQILSNPRVTTQNNVQATIIQGDQIPIQTVSNNTVTVQFKDAALRLAVTPQITAADTVIMQIEIDNDFANFGESVNGIPPIVTQRAITTVQVANGDTTVIGGIYESDRQRRNDRVPGLSRIPLLGWLFRRETDAENTDELLIFLTPYIVR